MTLLAVSVVRLLIAQAVHRYSCGSVCHLMWQITYFLNIVANIIFIYRIAGKFGGDLNLAV